MITQANSINERIGYPEFILDGKNLDKLYKNVNNITK